jgi:hypothetical protein
MLGGDKPEEAMETQAERDKEDCTVVRKPCGCAVIMCVTKYVDRETKREIGNAVAEGCSVLHMTAEEARKETFMCKCAPKQEQFSLV